MINKIIADTGVKNRYRKRRPRVHRFANGESAEKAKKMVDALTKDVVVGETYMGTVTRLMNFGVFVAVLPGKEGLVHISQLAPGRVEKVEDVVKVGDEIMVKVVEIDSQGRINLSRKAVLGGGSPGRRVRAPSAPRNGEFRPAGGGERSGGGDRAGGGRRRRE